MPLVGAMLWSTVEAVKKPGPWLLTRTPLMLTSPAGQEVVSSVRNTRLVAEMNRFAASGPARGTGTSQPSGRSNGRGLQSVRPRAEGPTADRPDRLAATPGCRPEAVVAVVGCRPEAAFPANIVDRSTRRSIR